MLYLVTTNICTNITLLVMLALLLCRTPFFREILLGGDDGREGKDEAHGWDLRNQVVLGLVFAAFCILSDRIGLQVRGALPNARVIGVLSAGFLGGPWSAMLTAVIAAVHRYLVFPERISTVSCVLSTLVQGVMAAFIGWKKRDGKNYTDVFLGAVTFLAELVHIVLILWLTRPFEQAVEIVVTVIVPMAVMNSVGMIMFFNTFKSIFNEADTKAALTVSLALRTAERCTPYLQDALTDAESAQRVIDIIMSEYHCQGVAMVRDLEFLGRSREFSSIVLRENNYPRLLSAAKTYRTTRTSRIPKPEDAFYPLYEKHVILAAPIILSDDLVPVLVILVRKNMYSYRADTEFASGLANFFATQIRLAEMEKQKEKLRRAEIRALQTQINPHFLFNALNTISCFCREKPEKARELLLALSSYFRNMLNAVDLMVPLETELEHVRAYVMLEEARFEDRLAVDIDAGPEDCTCHVPSLILQPIVENAIKHGAMKREQGRVSIRVRRGEKETLIDVEDNGPGMDKRYIDSLYEKDPDLSRDETGGIGMRNVQMRLVEIFGSSSGLEVISGETGTLVRMVIPNNQKESLTDENSSR